MAGPMPRRKMARAFSGCGCMRRSSTWRGSFVRVSNGEIIHLESDTRIREYPGKKNEKRVSY